MPMYCSYMATAEKRIAIAIEGLMDDQKMTTAELSRKSGIPYNTLKRRLATGRDLTVDEVEIIASALSVDALGLFSASTPSTHKAAA